MHVSFFDHCTVCKKGFETNFKHKITCSITCSKEHKNAQQREVYHSDQGYKAKKKAAENLTAASKFLGMKL